MNPWFAKTVIILSSVAMVIIRAPHGQRSRTVKVAKSPKSTLEVILLSFAWLGFFIPLIWVASPVFAFADFPLLVVPFIVGALCLALGLWLFHRSHADLGPNWSITLEVREQHQLITHGTYRHVRHPMYSALLLYSLGQALVIPNWVAASSYGVTFGLLFALRLGPEERMMRDVFGQQYETYMARTKRIIPGIW